MLPTKLNVDWNAIRLRKEQQVLRDNDRENATRKPHTYNVSDYITFSLATAQSESLDADLALVNVTIDIHESLAEAITGSSIRHMIVAGVLDGAQLERCAAVYRRPIMTKVIEGEWSAAVLGPRNEPMF